MGATIRAFILTGLLAASIASAGCKVYTPWEEVKGDFPWEAPGAQVRAETRSFAFAPIPAGGVEDRWIGGGGRTYVPNTLMAKADQFLKDAGVMKEWPVIHAPLNDREEIREAPFRFYIVSVRPTVILMQPSDSDARTESYVNVLGLRDLTNYVRCRTDLPYSREMFWFSPDLRQPPIALKTEGKDFESIPLPDGRLKIELIGGDWKIRRE